MTMRPRRSLRGAFYCDGNVAASRDADGTVSFHTIDRGNANLTMQRLAERLFHENDQRVYVIEELNRLRAREAHLLTENSRLAEAKQAAQAEVERLREECERLRLQLNGSMCECSGLRRQLAEAEAEAEREERVAQITDLHAAKCARVVELEAVLYACLKQADRGHKRSSGHGCEARCACQGIKDRVRAALAAEDSKP